MGDHPDHLVEADVDGLRQRSRQVVVATPDLAVALAPGELDVQLLRVGQPQRRGRGALGDSLQQLARVFGKPGAARPLGHRLVEAGWGAFDPVPQLLRKLGARLLRQPVAVEDDVRGIGAQAELGRQLQSLGGHQVQDVVLAVVDHLGPHVGVLAVVQPIPDREHAPAHPVARLQDHHLVAGLLDFLRGDQPGEPGADHEQSHTEANLVVDRCPTARSVPPSSAKSAAASPSTEANLKPWAEKPTRTVMAGAARSGSTTKW